MSRASVRVRPVDISDVPDLVALSAAFDLSGGVINGRAAPDSSEEHIAARFADIIRREVRTMLVAVDDTHGVVGLLVAKRDDIGAIDLTPVLHVTHLVVAPGYRRRGVGRQLLSAAVHLADERDLDHVLATAGSGSREVNRYLSRLGFAPLVTHRVAATSVLRRALGMAEAPDRMAVLRRARLVRGSRSTRTLATIRTARRGA